MKARRILFTAIIMSLFIIFGGTTALAAVENWTTDPATGGKIDILLPDDSYKLVSASWSGPLVDGKAEGKGCLNFIYKDKDGAETKAQVDGEMKAGKLDGRVSIKWSDGDAYDGQYKDGRRDGKGVYRFADGRSYDGDWKAGNFDGKGLYKWPNGMSYEGDYVANGMEGKGVFRWPNGEVYEGGFHNNYMEGKGVYKYLGGEVYEGDFVKGQRHGQGVMRDAAGKVMYEGEWRDHQPVNQSAGTRGKLTGFLGIAWGTGRQEAEKIILARPNTRWFSKKDSNFIGSFNEQPAFLVLNYQDGKLVSGSAWLPATEDEVLPLFEKLKAQLTDKYGKADQEAGKYLDSAAQWKFPGDGPNNYIVMRIIKSDAFVADQTLPSALRKPFSITLSYVKGDVQAQQVQQQQSGSNDL